jgi:hypothetical protein
VAKVFGEAGRNAAEESYRLTRRFLLVTLVGIAVLSLIEGPALSGACADSLSSQVRMFKRTLAQRGISTACAMIGLWITFKTKHLHKA